MHARNLGGNRDYINTGVVIWNIALCGFFRIGSAVA
jgi:hypothetical protein